jgi:tetratricopeptide (TPR) repeat protein
MKFRFINTTALALLSAFVVYGQTSPAPVRSHVERFSSPETRAGLAETEATKKLNANPNDADALNARALARMRFGRYKEASEDLRRAVALKPSSADYQANLGYVLWKLGQPLEAVAAERAALKLDDRNFTAHYQLGRFLLRLGEQQQIAEAAAHLRRALELDPRSYEVRFELLAAYRALGDPAQALAQLNLLQDARPSDPRVTYIRGLLASDRGDLKAATNDFREALRLDPTLVGAWQDLGIAYLKQQRWPEAVESFAEITRRQPDSAEAAYFHALSLFNARRDAEAETEVRRTLRLEPSAAAAHTLLGIILFTRSGPTTEARDALAQAVALDPNSFDAFYYLGRVQGDMKDYAGATESLRRATALNPKHQFARFLLGYALEVSGQLDAALSEYKALVEIDPASAIGQMGLGAISLKQGRNDEAIAALERAVNLNPSLFEAQWALGLALTRARRDAEAIEAFRKATALAPGRPDGHYQLGLALQRAGRKDEAAREFEMAKKITTEFRTGGENVNVNVNNRVQ